VILHAGENRGLADFGDGRSDRARNVARATPVTMAPVAPVTAAPVVTVPITPAVCACARRTSNAGSADKLVGIDDGPLRPPMAHRLNLPITYGVAAAVPALIPSAALSGACLNTE
jgi:hypothetical protein